MEAANNNRNSGVPELSRDIEGTGILIGLNTDQRNKTEIVVISKAGKERWNVDARVCFIDRFDVDNDVWPEDLLLGAIGCDSIHGGERI